jgi:hypothetical protein
MLNDIIDQIRAIWPLLPALAAVAYVINIYRKARLEHPVFQYEQHSIPNQANWRWRKPNAELGLKLEDDEQKSCLHIPLRLLTAEKVYIVSGYLMAVTTLYFFVLLVMRDAELYEYLLILFFPIMGFIFINVGNRVSSVSLYPDHLVVIDNYAFILKRIIIYKHQPSLKFKGKLQSAFEVTFEQDAPDFNLYIKRRYFYIFSWQRIFWLSLNQSQGSWLVAGLEYWRDHAGLQKNNAVVEKLTE